MHNHSGKEKECIKVIYEINIKKRIKETNNVYKPSIPKAFINGITKNNISKIPKYSTLRSSLYRT